jgi:hypothetical protein
MRILNRTQFLALEGEVLFSKYAPCYMADLEIKLCNSGTNDFCTQQIADAIECTGSDDFGDKLVDAQENGTQLKLDFDCGGRDGCFDADQLFAVWEPEDVRQLITRLQEILPRTESPREIALIEAQTACRAVTSSDTDWDTSYWNQAVERCIFAIDRVRSK